MSHVTNVTTPLTDLGSRRMIRRTHRGSSRPAPEPQTQSWRRERLGGSSARASLAMTEPTGNRRPRRKLKAPGVETPVSRPSRGHSPYRGRLVLGRHLWLKSLTTYSEVRMATDQRQPTSMRLPSIRLTEPGGSAALKRVRDCREALEGGRFAPNEQPDWRQPFVVLSALYSRDLDGVDDDA